MHNMNEGKDEFVPTVSACAAGPHGPPGMAWVTTEPALGCSPCIVALSGFRHTFGHPGVQVGHAFGLGAHKADMAFALLCGECCRVQIDALSGACSMQQCESHMRGHTSC